MGFLKDFYKREFKSVISMFPKLKPAFKDNLWHLEGNIDVIDEFGQKWDQYKIRIIFPSNYPKAVPTMFEIEDRIPKKDDYHVNPNGSCCLSVPAMEMIILSNGLNAVDYINKLVMPYLANQTYRSIFGHYAGEEFEHGMDGITQFYNEVFNSKDQQLIIGALTKIISNKIPERNEPCFCNGGQKYKLCHLKSIRYLSPVSKSVLIEDLKYLLIATNKIKDTTSK